MNSFPYNKSSGFTLAEALIALAIASTILITIYTYFTDSMRNVAQTGENVDTIHMIQNLIARVRNDVYNVADFPRPQGAPIDIAWSTSGYSPERFYQPLVYEETGDFSTLKQVEPTIKKWKFDDELKKWVDTVKMDDLFTRIPARHHKNHLWEDLVVTTEKEVQEPVRASVREISLSVNRNAVKGIQDQKIKLIYRHFLKDASGKPLNYLILYYVNPQNAAKEISYMSFGTDEAGAGKVLSFAIDPVFEYSMYNDETLPAGEQAVIEATRVYFRVSFQIQATKAMQTGPEGRVFDFSFNVANPYMNAIPFTKGIF